MQRKPPPCGAVQKPDTPCPLCPLLPGPRYPELQVFPRSLPTPNLTPASLTTRPCNLAPCPPNALPRTLEPNNLIPTGQMVWIPSHLMVPLLIPSRQRPTTPP